MSNNAYIVSAVRTPGGKKNGSLSLLKMFFLYELSLAKISC